MNPHVKKLLYHFLADVVFAALVVLLALIGGSDLNIIMGLALFVLVYYPIHALVMIVGSLISKTQPDGVRFIQVFYSLALLACCWFIYYQLIAHPLKIGG